MIFDTYKSKCNTLNKMINNLMLISISTALVLMVIGIIILISKISGSTDDIDILIKYQFIIVLCLVGIGKCIMGMISEIDNGTKRHKSSIRYQYESTNDIGNFSFNDFELRKVGDDIEHIVLYKSSDKSCEYKMVGKDIDTYDEYTEEEQEEGLTDELKINKLDDVQGIDEIKSDIIRVIDSLVNPDKYKRLGARPTKGLILAGPPGTGKTMIAKAMASDAGVNFIDAVGSDFIEKYVGVGAQRVRELFNRARQKKPAILFIDEIDAVGSSRANNSNGEHIQTLNAFLSELDGFSDNDGILVIGATNRIDSLDSAFTRAGRFDLILNVNLPDIEGREKILSVHSRNKVFSNDINLRDISAKTAGFSGAELENLLNESALIAGSRNQDSITQDCIDDAFFKIIMKGGKKKFKKDEIESKIVAWHEAGHTLAIRLLTDEEVSQVTVLGSTSGAGGVTFRTPKDRLVYSKKQIENSIMTMYAGRAAEEILLGNPNDITTGASEDIRKATSQIKMYIELYGMGKAGLVDLTQFSNSSNKSLYEASEISKSLYAKVLNILKENESILKDIAENLLDKETLTSKEIDNIIGERNLGKYINRDSLNNNMVENVEAGVC